MTAKSNNQTASGPGAFTGISKVGVLLPEVEAAIDEFVETRGRLEIDVDVPVASLEQPGVKMNNTANVNAFKQTDLTLFSIGLNQSAP
jgi:hypothetical protein